MTITRPLLSLLAALLAAPALAAETTTVTPLLTQPFADLAGREGTMLTVEYAPGATDPAHRHDAHVFVYVLEGHVVMQVKNGPEVRLGPGQTFYESPNDVHVVGRNASTTERAKFLVFFVKKQGAPVLTPVQP